MANKRIIDFESIGTTSRSGMMVPCDKDGVGVKKFDLGNLALNDDVTNEALARDTAINNACGGLNTTLTAKITAEATARASADKVYDFFSRYVVDSAFVDTTKMTPILSSSLPYETGIMKADGTIYSLSGYYVYTITNSSSESSWRTLAFRGLFNSISAYDSSYAKIEIKDKNSNLVYRGLIEGDKVILIPQGYTIRVSITGSEQKNFSVQTTASNGVILNNAQERISTLEQKESLIVDYPRVNLSKVAKISQTTYQCDENKLLGNSGSLTSVNGWNTYTITNDKDADQYRYLILVAMFSAMTGASSYYVDVRLTDSSGNVIINERTEGYKAILIPNGWTLQFSIRQIYLNSCYVQNSSYGCLINAIQSAGGDSFVIDCVGDSLTAAGTYETELKTLLGSDWTVNNYGVGGENVGTIFGRTNSIPYKVKENFTIPAATESVQILITNDYGGWLLPLLQKYSTFSVEIGGIAGTLSTDASSASASSANYFFTRSSSGDSVSISAGEEILISQFASLNNADHYKIIWVGQNGGFTTNETNRYAGSVSSSSDRAQLISMISIAEQNYNAKKTLILSAPKNTNDNLENEMSKAFGFRYFNVRKFMMNNGIRIAYENGWISSPTPTEQDETDIANGIIPTSLRGDSVHFNEAGYKTLAVGIYNRIKTIWKV